MRFHPFCLALIRECRKILFSSCVENWNRAKWPQIKLFAHKHGLVFDWIERRDLNLRISKVMVNFLAQSIAVIDPPLLRSYEWMSCAAHARSPRKFINKPCVRCGSRDRALQKRTQQCTQKKKKKKTRNVTSQNEWLKPFKFSHLMYVTCDQAVAKNILHNTPQNRLFFSPLFIHSSISFINLFKNKSLHIAKTNTNPK